MSVQSIQQSFNSSPNQQETQALQHALPMLHAHDTFESIVVAPSAPLAASYESSLISFAACTSDDLEKFDETSVATTLEKRYQNYQESPKNIKKILSEIKKSLCSKDQKNDPAALARNTNFQNALSLFPKPPAFTTSDNLHSFAHKTIHHYETLLAAVYKKSNETLENKDLVDAALRSFFAKDLAAKVGPLLYSSSEQSFAPESEPIISLVQDFLACDGLYSPSTDLSGLYCAPFLRSIVEETAVPLKAKNNTIQKEILLNEARAKLTKQLTPTLNGLEPSDAKVLSFMHEHALEERIFFRLENDLFSRVDKDLSPEDFGKELAKLTLLFPKKSIEKSIARFYSARSPALGLDHRLASCKAALGSIAHEGLRLLTAKNLAEDIIDAKKNEWRASLPKDFPVELASIYESLSQGGTIPLASFMQTATISLSAELEVGAALLCHLKEAMLKKAGELLLRKSTKHGLKARLDAYEEAVKAIASTARGSDKKSKAFALQKLESYLKREALELLLQERKQANIIEESISFERSGTISKVFFEEILAIDTFLGNFPLSFSVIDWHIEKLLGSKEALGDACVALVAKNKLTTLEQNKLATYRWALQVLQGSLVAPPEKILSPSEKASDPLVQALIDELNELRGTACNGTIHQAWVSYITLLASEILSYDNSCPPGDKGLVVKDDDYAFLKKNCNNSEALLAYSQRLLAMKTDRKYGNYVISMLQTGDFRATEDFQNFLKAATQTEAAKKHFDDLKQREVAIAGDGFSAEPELDEDGNIIGYRVAQNSLIAQAFA